MVLDGEPVVRDPARALSFGHCSGQPLPEPAARRARPQPPGFFIAFDVLQAGGDELPGLPYRKRRRLLEVLFAAHVLTSPWMLCPMTTDLAKARERLEAWTGVSGVESILITAMNQRHLPNHRGWTKIRCRDTTEAVGASTGTLISRQLLVVGRHDGAGRYPGRHHPVRRDLVAEISADRAIDRGGIFTHPVRYRRLSADRRR
ncbi:hypothetical protein [Streptomyces sp. NPDC090112]|uniref:ATP-dependent DNA ligase n=1 Tax=Streptomyces sp. NPDC090112 TaxID=3365949 RepID=UPI0037F34B9D